MEPTLLNQINDWVPLGVFFVSLIGLYQISIAKEAIRKTSEREAAKLAAERCKEYAEETIQSVDSFIEEIESQGYEMHESPMRYYTQDDLTKEDLAWIKKWSSSSSFDIKELTKVTNRMEAFAMYFVHGVADKEIGYKTCGIAFCSQIKQLLTLLVASRKSSKSMTNEDCINLYKEWSQRIEKDQIRGEIEELSNKFKQL